MRKHGLNRGMRLAGAALVEGGYNRKGMSVEWDMAPRCEAPVNRELLVRPEPPDAPRDGRGVARHEWRPGSNPGANIDYAVRCRRCSACLRYRRNYWALRARAETIHSVRTWFGTLTLSPVSHHTMLCRADARLSRGGTRFETLSEQDQFAERHKEISREITLWLKRVRKVSGAPLRVLVVVEKHESGLPHYHLLVHETSPLEPVTYRQLSNQWPHGHSMFKLLEPNDVKSCWYVTKYLADNPLARIRSSVDYGNPPQALLGLGGAERATEARMDYALAHSPKGRVIPTSGTVRAAQDACEARSAVDLAQGGNMPESAFPALQDK